MEMENVEIIHKEKKNRIYILKESHKAKLKYRRKQDSILEIYKTEVPVELRGKGLGNKLMEEFLEYALKNQFKVRPTCSFAQKFIEKYPQYHSLVVKDEGVDYSL